MASKVGNPKGFPSLAPKGQTADGSIYQIEAPRRVTCFVKMDANYGVPTTGLSAAATL